MQLECLELVASATVSFDLSVFSLDCVKRAAYRVTAKASVEIATEAGNAVCVIHFSKPVTQEAAAKAVEGLRLEVLDQDLRSVVAAETASVRNTILALAFSRSGLQSDD
jgi:His-Xaa-Ser system protein HxsD